MSKDKKLPAFQFYPGDWRKDLGVQSLDFFDRGVWFEMLMIMHDSERRGVLVLNGTPMSDYSIARAIGLDKQNFGTTLSTLLSSGVASRDDETGAIVCRRMIRDEEIRKIRAVSGKLGGNPVLLNQKPTTQDKQKPTPSSSSSSSSLKQIHIPKDKPVKESILLPIFITQDLWDTWIEHRKGIASKKGPFTPRATTIFLNLAQKCYDDGFDVVKMIESSILGGHPSIYPDDRSPRRKVAFSEKWIPADESKDLFSVGGEL